MTNPKVSVILPTYGRSRMLRRAIRSVLSQTYRNLELVVVNDASPDDTRKVVNGFDDDRIIYIEHETNKGQAAAENTGIEASDGEYVAFIDDDVEWCPTKLEKQVSVLENADERVGVVHCSYYNEVNGNLREGDINDKSGYVYRDILAKDLTITTSKLMVKRRCLDECGLWDTELPGFIDFDLCLRLAREYEIEVVDEPLVISPDHSHERITSGWKSSREAMNAIIDKWGDEMKDELGDDAVERYRKLTMTWIYWQSAMENALSRCYFTATKMFARYIQREGYPGWKRISFFAITLIGGPRMQNFAKKIWFATTGTRRGDMCEDRNSF